MHTTLNEYYYTWTDKRIPDGTYLRVDADTLKPVRHSFGYYVAHTDFNAPRSAYQANTPEQVRQIIHGLNDDGYVGIWTDDEGVTWVEQAFWVEHLFPAKALGQAWHQKAIWDCSHDEEIIL